MEKDKNIPLLTPLTTIPKTLLEIKAILLKKRAFLNQKYSVKNLAIFGSYTRGDQTAHSDVDLLVEFEITPGLAFIRLADELEQLLGIKVDLLTSQMIHHNPYLEASIKEDLTLIF